MFLWSADAHTVQQQWGLARGEEGRGHQHQEKEIRMIRCPQCGNDEEFALEAVEYVIAYVTQIKQAEDWYEAGDLEIYDTKSQSGSEWEEDSSCRCTICQYTAPLNTFEVAEEGDNA